MSITKANLGRKATILTLERGVEALRFSTDFLEFPEIEASLPGSGDDLNGARRLVRRF